MLKVCGSLSLKVRPAPRIFVALQYPLVMTSCVGIPWICNAAACRFIPFKLNHVILIRFNPSCILVVVSHRYKSHGLLSSRPYTY